MTRNESNRRAALEKARQDFAGVQVLLTDAAPAYSFNSPHRPYYTQIALGPRRTPPASRQRGRKHHNYYRNTNRNGNGKGKLACRKFL